MKNKVAIFIFIFITCIINNVFAVLPQKKMSGNTLVETGTSIENGNPHIKVGEETKETEDQKARRKELMQKNQEGELICDLNYGLLGDLLIGDYTNISKVEEVIKESSVKNKFFSNTGVAVVLGENLVTNEERIYMIIIYPSGVNFSWIPMEPFKGKIVPELNENDTVESIREKFGSPERIEKIFTNTVYAYNKPYGKLSFGFKEEDGKLWYITMGPFLKD
ncbi:MAG: hypothetical protein AMJ95_01505 [Omnitrophica WOR_2 bacterium SM23_72]|nr:MAG: hypothetical protein AMJ95_01505 [Omnitrophica WOR_2 bacterium SM23_72]